MDNTLAFFLDPEGPERTRAALQRTERVSERLTRALRRVTVAGVERALAASGAPPHEILTPAEIRAVVARREFVERHVQALVAAHGAKNVLVFP